MADYEPREPVMYHAPGDGPHDPGHVLSAVVIQFSTKRVYLRIALPNGRNVFRWVSQRHVSRLDHAEA